MTPATPVRRTCPGCGGQYSALVTPRVDALDVDGVYREVIRWNATPPRCPGCSQPSLLATLGEQG